jgi:hypothetical protein
VNLSTDLNCVGFTTPMGKGGNSQRSGNAPPERASPFPSIALRRNGKLRLEVLRIVPHLTHHPQGLSEHRVFRCQLDLGHDPDRLLGLRTLRLPKRGRRSRSDPLAVCNVSVAGIHTLGNIDSKSPPSPTNSPKLITACTAKTSRQHHIDTVPLRIGLAYGVDREIDAAHDPVG